MSNPLLRRWVLPAVAAFVALVAPAWSQDSNQQRQQPQDLVTAADGTLSNFLRDPQMTWLQANIGRAKGVLIAPEVVKAGFIFGGSGGRAALLVKNASGKWMGPAFYTLATASAGFQAGISVSEDLMLVMTEKGVNSLMTSSFKLGGDASVAAGPVGAGAKSDITADFISFSRAKGVYGGLNVDGTVVKTNDDWNAAYYNNQTVLPPDILIRGTVQSRGSAPLLGTIAKATAK